MKKENKRTVIQNKSMYLYFEMLATHLNESGLDMRLVLDPEIEIPWSKISIHDKLWLPIQIALYDKHSTTELDTAQVDEVYRVLNRHLSEKFGISVPFPSRSGE